MHSYTTLAVLALALSTASPAFSAPVLEIEQQARADIDERASILAGGLGKDIGGLLKSVGISAAFGAIPVAIEHFLDGNSTRRALSDNEKRDPGIASLFGDLLKGFKTDDGIGKVLGNGILGGLASGGAALGVGELLDNTKREPAFALSDFKGIAKSLAGVLASLGAADGVKELFGSDNTRREPSPFSLGALGDIAGTLESLFSSLLGGESAQRRDDVSDLVDALQLLSRQLDELD